MNPTHSSEERQTNRKYWFPAVICMKSVDAQEGGVKSPVIACPKCEFYGGTKMDERGSYVLCEYQSSGETANKEVK